MRNCYSLNGPISFNNGRPDQNVTKPDIRHIYAIGQIVCKELFYYVKNFVLEGSYSMIIQIVMFQRVRNAKLPFQ